MKWIKPNTGTERTARKFAWFPTRLDDEPTPVVWLEFYYERQVYGYDSFWGVHRWSGYTKTQEDSKLQFWEADDRRREKIK